MSGAMTAEALKESEENEKQAFEKDIPSQEDVAPDEQGGQEDNSDVVAQKEDEQTAAPANATASIPPNPK